MGAIFQFGGKILKWGITLFAADQGSRVVTGEGLVDHAADAVSDNIVQPVLEGIAESGVDAEQHASGQSLISWSNWVESIPFLGQSSFGKWIAEFLRDWGEGYQNSNTENDGTTVPSTADVNLRGDFMDSAITGATIGGTVGFALGSVFPVVGNGLGTVVGTGLGVAGATIDHISGGWLSDSFRSATEWAGLREPRPAATLNLSTPSP